MQGKLLINKPGQIPCGLINASTMTVNGHHHHNNHNNNSNNHLQQQQHHHQQQQQQPQHLNHINQHNGLNYSINVNQPVNNLRLCNGGSNRIEQHKRLDRSASEPVEKIFNRYITQSQTQRYQQRNSMSSMNSIMNTAANNNSNSNSNNNNNNNVASIVNSPKCLNNNNNLTASSRYKTELCRPFEENGTCKYGDKCQFAHGYHELRNLQRHPRYKTVLCRTFHTVGFCPYGPRCHFIHNSEESKKSIIHTLQTGSSDITSEPSSPTSSIFENLSPLSPSPPSLLDGSTGSLTCEQLIIMSDFFKKYLI